MSFLAHIAACNRHDLSNFRPFVVAGRRVGWIKPGFAARLAEFPETFKVDADSVTLDPALDDFDTRSKAVDRVLRRLAAAGVIPGWRHEAYSVGASFDAPPLMKMERAAVPAFGIRACGVHMNGFVRKNGALHMWVPRRSRDRPTYPGLFDNLVAGGLAHGLSPRQCLVKECGEEAGIPPALAARAVAVGTLSYTDRKSVV